MEPRSRSKRRIANFQVSWKSRDCVIRLCSQIDRARLLTWAVQEVFNMDAMQDFGLLDCAYMPQDPIALTYFRKEWASFKRVFTWNMPIDQLRDYFGEQTALYFAWMRMYVKTLCIPALCGLIGGVVITVTKDTPHSRAIDYVRVSLAFICAGWASWFYSSWQAEQALLSLRWGTNQFHNGYTARAERPGFISDFKRRDPVNPNRWQHWYAPSKSFYRKCLTNLVTAVAVIAAVVIVNGDLHEYLFETWEVEDHVNKHINSKQVVPFTVDSTTMILPLTTAVLAFVCDQAWSWLAEKLTIFENHRHNQGFERSIVRKLFFFAAFDYFIPLYHLAFTKPHYRPCFDEDPEEGRCLVSLQGQLQSIFIVAAVTNLVELGLP